MVMLIVWASWKSEKSWSWQQNGLEALELTEFDIDILYRTLLFCLKYSIHNVS